MEDLRTQQIEALEVAVPYCAKISNALNNLMEELNGHRQPDTDEYMKKIDALAGALHLQRITLLPFHNMGAPKYRALGLEYEYQNTPPVERSLLEKLSRNFTNKTIE